MLSRTITRRRWIGWGAALWILAVTGGFWWTVKQPLPVEQPNSVQKNLAPTTESDRAAGAISPSPRAEAFDSLLPTEAERRAEQLRTQLLGPTPRVDQPPLPSTTASPETNHAELPNSVRMMIVLGCLAIAATSGWVLFVRRPQKDSLRPRKQTVASAHLSSTRATKLHSANAMAPTAGFPMSEASRAALDDPELAARLAAARAAARPELTPIVPGEVEPELTVELDPLGAPIVVVHEEVPGEEAEERAVEPAAQILSPESAEPVEAIADSVPHIPTETLEGLEAALRNLNAAVHEFDSRLSKIEAAPEPKLKMREATPHRLELVNESVAEVPSLAGDFPSAAEMGPRDAEVPSPGAEVPSSQVPVEAATSAGPAGASSVVRGLSRRRGARSGAAAGSTGSTEPVGQSPVEPARADGPADVERIAELRDRVLALSAEGVGPEEAAEQLGLSAAEVRLILRTHSGLHGAA